MRTRGGPGVSPDPPATLVAGSNVWARANVAAYLRLIRAGFRSQSAYRLAMVAGLFTNVVFGFVKAAILFATVNAAGGDLHGYDLGLMSAYVWLSQGLLSAVAAMGQAEIGERIKSGDIAVDFTRPLDLQTWHLCQDLGRGLYTLLPRGVPSVLVGAATFGLTMPTTALPYVLGVVSLLAAMALSFYCRYAVSILGFWVVETRGLTLLYSVVSTFLMGLAVPVRLFPEWLALIANATPFPSILMAPIDVFSGRVLGWEAARVIAIQLMWALLIAVIGRVLTRAGRIKMEVQGG